MPAPASTYSGALGKGFVTVELKNSPLPEVRRQLRELKTTAVKDLLKDVGEFWHSQILPKHFTSANREYHLAPRTEKYLRRKQRMGRGVGKYVYDILTGQSQRRMTYEYEVTGTSSRASVLMNAPAYFTDPYDPTGNQPDKVAEVLEVSSNDLLLMTSFAQRRLAELAGIAINLKKAA